MQLASAARCTESPQVQIQLSKSSTRSLMRPGSRSGAAPCLLWPQSWPVGCWSWSGSNLAFQELLSNLPARLACQPQSGGGPDCCSAEEAGMIATSLCSQASSQAALKPEPPSNIDARQCSLLHWPAGLARAAGVKSQRRAAASGCAISSTVQAATAPRRSSCRAQRPQMAPMAAALCESHLLHRTTCWPAASAALVILL